MTGILKQYTTSHKSLRCFVSGPVRVCADGDRRRSPRHPEGSLSIRTWVNTKSRSLCNCMSSNPWTLCRLWTPLLRVQPHQPPQKRPSPLLLQKLQPPLSPLLWWFVMPRTIRYCFSVVFVIGSLIVVITGQQKASLV